ncbi:hypothetical protein DRQ05_01520 [bacterium]|nr:MAG: hypothetical protein DRQ05_01520 [bacterium]
MLLLSQTKNIIGHSASHEAVLRLRKTIAYAAIAKTEGRPLVGRFHFRFFTGREKKQSRASFLKVELIYYHFNFPSDLKAALTG